MRFFYSASHSLKKFIEYLRPKEFYSLYRHSDIMIFFYFKSLDVHGSCDNPFAELGMGGILAAQMLCTVISKKGQMEYAQSPLLRT